LLAGAPTEADAGTWGLAVIRWPGEPCASFRRTEESEAPYWVTLWSYQVPVSRGAACRSESGDQAPAEPSLWSSGPPWPASPSWSPPVSVVPFVPMTQDWHYLARVSRATAEQLPRLPYAPVRS